MTDQRYGSKAGAKPALDVPAGSACTHECTQGREGETGSWCVKCGLKIHEVEQRECQHCAHFKAMGAHEIPICRKHMMGVTRTMRVTYAIKDGTCFSPNTSGLTRRANDDAS